MQLFWSLLLVIGSIIFVAFSFVILFGAPFLPTLKAQIPKALQLIDLKPGETLLELGSGDGRVLIAAAEQGLRVVGYELNPILFLYSWLKTRRYGGQVRVIWGNYWFKEWPPVDGIFVFLLQPYMRRLNKKIVHSCRRPVKVVSFAFHIPGHQPTKTNGGLFLYSYR
ncbi:class I SAM-dependent methyltransferase [Candidatus Saccharibacteria bacterium]|nr:class I SAM-dependent methyltransferase [Candidatus Saccharibacteria bacterium]